MKKSKFIVHKMDCPSEEQLIRMRLQGNSAIKRLEFDIANRSVVVIHNSDPQCLLAEIGSLNLEAELLTTEDVPTNEATGSDLSTEIRLLLYVFCINLFFFFFEIIIGFVFNSMGLVADGLDMLADALVYGLALFAASGSAYKKKTVAKVAGYFQLSLALFGFIEVIRRFIGFDSMPVFEVMIGASVFALIGNAASYIILKKTNSNEPHIRASMIFTSNDIIINIGVIAAGLMVMITNSKYPDLIIGGIIFYLVIKGAIKILNLAK